MHRQLDEKTLVNGQISPEDVPALKEIGVTLIVNNRPDGEDAGLLNFYRGEALRLRGHTDDLPQALAAYKAALKSPDAPVETPSRWRVTHGRPGIERL